MDAKIAIAIVTNRQIKPKTVECLLNMVFYTNERVFPIVATEGYTTAEGRNYCVIQALKNECTHILFIDDDMIFPPDTLDILLKHKVDIVGVNSMSRALPLTTTIGQLKDGELWPHDKIPPYHKIPTTLFEVFSVGMGVALVDMTVFDKIPKPWFKFEVHENGKIMIGEDAWLCKQARENGMRVWCDPTLPIGHIGDYNYANYDVSSI